MKKLLLLFSLLASSSILFAQQIASGFYRVSNNGEGALIYVTDNTGYVSAANRDLNAIRLYAGLDKAISDPASVIYIANISGNKYDLEAQGTSVHSISGYYPEITWNEKDNGYRLGAMDKGLMVYLGASKIDASTNYAKLVTSAKDSFRAWTPVPITSSGDNYFGITPSISANGKYYQPFFADFAFSFASSGMKAYYVSEVKDGSAKFEEITGTTIPSCTPVIIECSSNSPSNNCLELKASGGSSVSGNLLEGVFFCNEARGNVTKNEESTMRVLGVTSDGKLGFVTSTASYIPANQCYLKVASDTPSTLLAGVEVGPVVNAESITLNNTKLELHIGESSTLTATIKPDNTTDKTVTWSSSDTSVATVEGGVVKAVAKGTATITAKCGSVSATCTVTVTAVEAESVVLDKTVLNLNVGQTALLSATVTPDNATNKTVTWASSDATVATVEGGVVKAMAKGTATITAKCGSVSATCTVTVSEVEAGSVTLNKTALELTEGETATLKAEVRPTSTTDKTVTWTSSDETVATVENGVVKAIAKGTATITATCGKVSATCTVTVKALVIEAESVTLDKTEIELTVGQADTLTVTVAPENVTNPAVTWTSSDETVATVENGIVTAIAEGTATITATCGKVSATCAVIVKPEETSISSVVADQTVCGVFSILGQKLRNDSSIEDLPAGIYIVNGKKVVKR